jgi:hypothetical protein
MVCVFCKGELPMTIDSRLDQLDRHLILSGLKEWDIDKVNIFYMDEEQCAALTELTGLGGELLSSVEPMLANTLTVYGAIPPGWYWQDYVDTELGEGPFETREECERDLLEAADGYRSVNQ